ncbi:MAG: hypothetical protein JWM98_2444 [Thermoleophilia bacterium]|nr:hypothetical protein [Thermoleophilia bacterium]
MTAGVSSNATAGAAAPVHASAQPAARPAPDHGSPGDIFGATAKDPVSDEAQAAADPLRPTAADGWSPDRVVPVYSRNQGGFAGSALKFALGGVDERPGQRLSKAQVDQLAPFYATQFGLDEGYVRGELAKVYLYVGGPSTTAKQAMTIGHHVFLPNEADLRLILQPAGRRWLAHELSHTMQFLAYQDASPHRFLAEYFSSMVLGRNPERPGSGSGPAVWGAAFTALRDSGSPSDEVGKPVTSLRDRAVSSVLPALVIGLPVATAAGGALAAARATTGAPWLGHAGPMRTGLGIVAAPMLAGSLAGAYGDKVGVGTATALGGVAGGLLAGATLWRSGAFAAGGEHALTGFTRTLGRGTALGVAVGLTAAGVALGSLAAAASANTVRGGADNAELLAAIRKRAGDQPETLGFQDALHDTHWLEVDAESLANEWVHGEWTKPTDGAPVTGRTPSGPHGAGAKIDQDLSDRLDWGVKIPLLLGIPAAVGMGAGVLGTRAGHTLLDATIRDGRGPVEALRESMRVLGSQNRGVGNSLGVGAAVTAAPLMTGGLVGPLLYNVTGSTDVARIGGAAASSVVAGTLLTLLLKGKGGGALSTSIKVGVGMAIAGGVGLLSSGVATDALRPGSREYDVSKGATAAT